MILQSRSQLVLGASIIIIFFVGILFFYLNRASQPVAIVNESVPNNQTFEVIDVTGNTQLYQVNTNSPVELQTRGLRQIVSEPVAGYRLITSGLSQKIRYINAETGQVHDYTPATGASIRVTDNTLPQITAAKWVTDDTVLLQYQRNGRNVNYVASINIASRELTGQIFPAATTAIVGLDENTVYYLVRDPDGSSLYRYQPSSQSSRFEQSFDLSELDLVTGAIANNQNELYAISRLSPNHQGQIIYRINPDGNRHEYLPTQPMPSQGIMFADKYLILMTDDGLVIQDHMTAEDSVSVSGTFTPAKCAGGVKVIICSQVYLSSQSRRDWPFNWFKGKIQPTENLVAINYNSGQTTTIAELQNYYDASQLVLGDEYVYFISRRDGSLYEVFTGDRI